MRGLDQKFGQNFIVGDVTIGKGSRIKLRVFDRMQDHNLLQLLDAGVVATVNSDDPAYFGGYINQNYAACIDALPLTRAHLHALARNSFNAAFLDDARRVGYLDEVDRFFATH